MRPLPIPSQKMIRQPRPQRFHLPISIPQKHESTVSEAPKKDPLRFLLLTGLFFGKRSPADSNLVYWLRVMRSTCLTVSSILLFFAILYHTVVHSKFAVKFASYHLACNWFFQACLNVCLIQYWQHNDKWRQDILAVLWSPFAERQFRQNRYLLMPICILILVFLLSVVIASNYQDEFTMIFKFDYIFQSKFLVVAGRLLSWYTTVVFLVVNFYFLTATGIVRSELHDFNRRFEKELSTAHLLQNANNNNAESSVDLFKTVHSFYLEHLRISNKIRELDRCFSIFAFTTAITTIPATVFGLWTFIVRLQSSWLHIFVTFLELLLCGIALLFLVINPSKIREDLLKTRALLFSSVSVWEYYEPRVCDVARLFVAHLDSNELGLSIWGFIIITKQFVLSVVSITLTFLVFLLETQHGSKTLVAHRAIPKLKP